MRIVDEAALDWYQGTLVDQVVDARRRTGHPMSDSELEVLRADIADLGRGWEGPALTHDQASLPSAGLSFLADSDWAPVDGDACRVSQFSPFGWIEQGRVCIPKGIPYAAIHFECTKLPGAIKGYITHKLDFLHLWAAVVLRGVGEGEELIVYWTSQHYRRRWLRYLSRTLPKLWVTIAHKGLLEYWKGHREVRGQRTIEEMCKPIASWKPAIIE